MAHPSPQPGFFGLFIFVIGHIRELVSNNQQKPCAILAASCLVGYVPQNLVGVSDELVMANSYRKRAGGYRRTRHSATRPQLAPCDSRKRAMADSQALTRTSRPGPAWQSPWPWPASALRTSAKIALCPALLRPQGINQPVKASTTPATHRHARPCTTGGPTSRRLSRTLSEQQRAATATASSSNSSEQQQQQRTTAASSRSEQQQRAAAASSNSEQQQQ